MAFFAGRVSYFVAALSHACPGLVPLLCGTCKYKQLLGLASQVPDFHAFFEKNLEKS